MYKEKHILNKHYGSHKLARYLDVYELNTVNCSADKTTGYKGDTITITGTPAWNQKISAYNVTGATLTGNQFYFTGSDVTAEAKYETAKNVTLQTDGHGSIAANITSGYIGDTVTLSNTPAANYAFSSYTLTGANLTGSTFNFTGYDVTAKAWFTFTAIVNPEKYLRDSNGNEIHDRNNPASTIQILSDDRDMYKVRCFDPVSAYYSYLMIDYEMSNSVTIPTDWQTFIGLSAGTHANVYTTASPYTGMQRIGLLDYADTFASLQARSAMFLNNSPVFGNNYGATYTAGSNNALVSAEHLMYKSAPTNTKHYKYLHDIRYGKISAWVNDEYIGSMPQTPIYQLQYIAKAAVNASVNVQHLSVAVFNSFTAATAWHR